MKFFDRLENLSNTLIMLLLLCAAAVQNGSILGVKTKDIFSKEKEVKATFPPSGTQLSAEGYNNITLNKTQEGIWSITDNQNNTLGTVISTIEFNRKTFGFSGPIPMHLYIDANETIKDVVILENSEDPDFLQSAIDNGIITQWIGKSTNELAHFTPDAISGATMSSNAINQSITSSIKQLNTGISPSGGNSVQWFDTKTIVALLILITGLFTSFASKKNKHIRTVQLLLNVVVLGLYCGKFLSLSTLLGIAGNGISLSANFIVAIMLILSVLLPLFGKKGDYYCTWVCPFGAGQELAGKLNRKHKWKLSPKTTKILSHSKRVITLGLLFAMWLGVSTDIAGYEPFSAFLFQHASVAVLLIALITLVLSIFIPRPWCRFACPTGQLLSWTRKFD